MSSIETTAKAQLGLGATQAEVTGWFQQQLLTALADPLFNIPKAFETWMVDRVAVSGLNIPIGQVVGYSRNQQAALVANTSTQSIASGLGSASVLSWDTTVYDLPSDGQHDDATNNSRLTCLVDGRYLPSAYIAWAPSATGNYRYTELRKNGTSVVGIRQAPVAGGASTEQLPGFPPQDLVAGDYLEIAVAQDSGGSLSVAVVSQFAMTRIA